MKYSEFLSETQKAHGWTGHGDPEVVVDGHKVVFAKVDNGRIWIETECADMQRELKNLERQIGDAEGEADAIIEEAKRDAKDAISDAIDALQTLKDDI